MRSNLVELGVSLHQKSWGEKEKSAWDGEGILTAIHQSPMLLLSFTDNLTGSNDDDSDGGD